jgi:hypothetical protein
MLEQCVFTLQQCNAQKQFHWSIRLIGQPRFEMTEVSTHEPRLSWLRERQSAEILVEGSSLWSCNSLAHSLSRNALSLLVSLDSCAVCAASTVSSRASSSNDAGTVSTIDCRSNRAASSSVSHCRVSRVAQVHQIPRRSIDGRDARRGAGVAPGPFVLTLKLERGGAPIELSGI